MPAGAAGSAFRYGRRCASLDAATVAERVARGAVGRILAGRAERELMEVALTDDHGAGSPEPPDHRGVGAGDLIGADAGRRGGGHTRDVDEVFERDRDAVERADEARRFERRVEPVGFCQSLGVDGDHGIDHPGTGRTPRTGELCQADHR